MAVTVTRTPGKWPATGKEYEILKFDWTSDASGDATSAATDVNGFLVKAITDPTDSPTDNYDITLVQNGGDALGGLLADRDTSNTEVKIPTDVIFLAGSHVFTVAAAGNAKSGVCYMYLVESL